MILNAHSNYCTPTTQKLSTDASIAQAHPRGPVAHFRSISRQRILTTKTPSHPSTTRMRIRSLSAPPSHHCTVSFLKPLGATATAHHPQIRRKIPYPDPKRWEVGCNHQISRSHVVVCIMFRQYSQLEVLSKSPLVIFLFAPVRSAAKGPRGLANYSCAPPEMIHSSIDAFNPDAARDTGGSWRRSSDLTACILSHHRHRQR